MDAEAYSEVTLRLSANNLPNHDTMSKSDPFAVLYLQTDGGATEEIGRTEVIYDNLSPLWIKNIDCVYHFESQQTLTIAIYDEDQKGSNDLRKHDKIGEVNLTLGNLMASSGQSMTLDLVGNAKVKIHAEELAICGDHVTFGLQCNKLLNKDGFFGKSDPFYVIYRLRESGEWMQVFQSAKILNNLNPRWLPYILTVRSLCNGDYDARLKIEINDYKSPDKFIPMGEVETSLRELISSVNQSSLDVIEPNKKGKSSYKNSGTLSVHTCTVYRVPTFADYLKGGLQLGFSVAVDYTGSNGNYTMPNSLHYLGGNPQQFNQYQNAIASIGPIIEDYDHDKKFSAYGFGAKPNPYSPVSHCFSLSETGEVDGIQGVLNAYTHALSQCRLSGPTLFGPVIATAMQQAAAQKAECLETGKQSYSILLILTDGVINDMASVKKQLKEASDLPLSIIIVGIGSADFSNMEELDGDQIQDPDYRDLVQFVAMKDYRNGMDIIKLRKDTLHEVPKQVTDYFKKANVMPSAPSTEEGV
jgi:hypothetical protein